MYSGTETRLRTSYAKLKQDAIQPVKLLGLDHPGSDYPTIIRNDRNTESIETSDFDNDRVIDWTAAWSMRQRRLVFIPTGMIFRDHPDFQTNSLGTIDSRGCGAGLTFDEAIVQGCYDIIKGDAAALWWLNRIVRPEISADMIDGSDKLSTLLHGNGGNRDIHLLDLTTDAGIPVVAAVSADNHGKRIAIGLGCDIEPAGAAFAAIEDHDMALHEVGAKNGFWTQQLLGDHFHLVPEGTSRLPGRDRSTMPVDMVKTKCLEILSRMANDVIVANLSKPETGVHCVRVLAPGLCDTGMRFAVDRLSYGPVASGWSVSPSDTTDCNPISYPFH